MLSDTVGFVQELPHELVDAFQATLEEVIEADLILHIRDAADPMFAEQGQVVKDTLEQLGLVGDEAPPVLEVLNKKDLVPGLSSYRADSITGSRIAVSAITGDGMGDLLALLSEWLQQDMHEMHLKLLVSDGRSIAFCHEHGTVLSKTANDEVMDIVVRLSPADAGRFKEESGIHSLL
jgi:GTP-binding protein HflX